MPPFTGALLPPPDPLTHTVVISAAQQIVYSMVAYGDQRAFANVGVPIRACFGQNAHDFRSWWAERGRYFGSTQFDHRFHLSHDDAFAFRMRWL
ncbi:hypothetical protein [Methylobacterium sp. CM6247]